jgi:threonine synthase
VTAAASRLSCAGCGWTAPDAALAPYPFRCPNAGRDDTDHVVTRSLDLARVAFLRGADPNPFVRHRELFHAYHVAVAHGMSDDAYVDLVRRLDEAVRTVDGHGFRVTPFERQDDLGERLGCAVPGGVWVKDETGNVSGSHKARHLMGIMTYLEVIERLGLAPGAPPPLAIASCGNAALAAAVVARAAGRVLRVYVPPHADAVVLERLHALGAELTTCPREPGARGDPCYRRFRAALDDGALPFCCQGPDDGLTIEGGETLGYEIVQQTGGADLDHFVIQVGGGALASACTQAFRLATRFGIARRLPRIHAVQTEGAFPLKRAYDRVVERIRHGESPEQALRYAATHRSEFMWPWEREPVSIAHGILDDETYDWLAVVRGMVESEGKAIVVSEETLREANDVARAASGIAVDHTGSAGLAGLLQLRREGTVAPTERVAVIFSGVDRRQTGGGPPPGPRTGSTGPSRR